MNKQTCAICRDLLPLYLDGVVSAGTAAFVEGHLADCPDCRAQLEQLRRPLALPPDTDAAPLEAVRKQWNARGLALWALGLSLLLLAVWSGETPLSEYLDQMLYGSAGDLLLLLVPGLAAGYGLEYLGRKKWPRLRPLAFLLPAAGLVLAEVIWLAGGWDRIGALLLTALCLPPLLGACLGRLIAWLREAPSWAKKAAAVLVLLLWTVTWFLWPRLLPDKLILAPAGPMLDLYPDGDAQQISITEEAALEQLRTLRITPARYGPDWLEQRCILLRLGPDYVLWAPYGGSAYICDYGGPLEEFRGADVRWRVCRYTSLYTALKTAGTVE